MCHFISKSKKSKRKFDCVTMKHIGDGVESVINCICSVEELRQNNVLIELKTCMNISRTFKHSNCQVTALVVLFKE